MIDNLKKRVSANPHIVILLLFFVLYFYLAYYDEFIALTPEENIRLFFIENTFATNTFPLTYIEGSNMRYGTQLIKPRNTVTNSHGEIVPSDSLGLYILFAFPSLLLPRSLTIASLYTVISVLGLYAVYKISGAIYNKSAALIGLVLVGVFPAYLFWAPRVMIDIPSLALILFGFSIYIQASKENTFTTKEALFSGFFMASGLAIKYPSLAIILFFLLAFFPYSQLNKKVLVFHIKLAISSVVFFSPILFLNHRLYGGAFVTGQALYSGSSTIIRVAENISYLTNIKKYFISFFGVLTAFGITAIVLNLKNVERTPFQVKFSVFILVSLAFNIIFFGKASDVYGAQTPEALLNHSQTRYFLPNFVLLIIPIGYLFTKARHFSVALFAMLASLFLVTGFDYKGIGLISIRKDMADAVQYKKEVLELIPPKSFVFTKLYDKVLFPQRKVVSYYNAGFDDVQTRITNTSNLLKMLKNDSRKVYFIKEDVDPILKRERNYEDFADYELVLTKLRLSLQHTKGNIYEVVEADE